MTENLPRRATTQTEPNRISHVFWRLADVEMGSVLRDPEWVVKTWLTAVDGLEGRRGGRETAQNALSFLMRLEKDPFYASPEQTRGGDKDSSGLVYSLALLLFERLTGHHPFVESLSPLECRIQRDRAKRVGKNNLCHLSSRLRAVLNKALSPFSEDRYPDVAMLRADIERWQRGEVPSLGIDGSSEKLPHSLMHSQNTPAPQRRRTQPPPTPRASQRFVNADTLQSAVGVRPAREPASPRVPKALAPWMWPSISAGFAFVAAIALFVAFKSNAASGTDTRAASNSQHEAQRSTLTGSPIDLVAPTGAQAETQDQAIEFDEADAVELKAPEIRAEQQVVALVRSCVANSKFRGGLDLGISVLFDSEGHISRSFTGKLAINRSETACLKAGLDTVVTDDPAQLGKMMRYDLYLSSQTERVRVHAAR